MAWLFGLAALMLLDSGTVLDAVNGAAGLFVRSVMPALFPMMVLNGLCARLGGREQRWMTVCFCWLSGSPASAQRLEGLWERGGLAGRELLPMAAATGVMSPLFLVGSLGGRLPNPAGGWLMLTAHWLGALAVAGLIRLFSRPQTTNPVGPKKETLPEPEPVSLLAALPDSLRQAGPALLAVCGAMMLFSILAALFRQGLGGGAPGISGDIMGRFGDRRRSPCPAGRFRRARPAPAVRPVQLRRAEHPDAEPAVSGQKHPPRKAAGVQAASRGGGVWNLRTAGQAFSFLSLNTQNLLTT